MRYNERHIDKLYRNGRNLISAIKATRTKLGDGNVTPKGTDYPSDMLTYIERLKGLNPDHLAGRNKSRYEARFERERESCLAELWKMYAAVQNYVDNGVFLDGSQSGMESFTTRLEDHLVRSNDESPKNGTFHRASEAHTKPITEGPLALVKGLVCEMHGPRYESPKTFKTCSRVDEVNGGRSVMAIKETQNYRDSLEYETYTVRLLGNSPWLMAGGGDHPLSRLSESTDPNDLASLRMRMHVKVIPAPRVTGRGVDHTVRVAVHKKIN